MVVVVTLGNRDPVAGVDRCTVPLVVGNLDDVAVLVADFVLHENEVQLQPDRGGDPGQRGKQNEDET